MVPRSLCDKLIEIVSVPSELEVTVAIHLHSGIENIDGQGTRQRDRAFLAALDCGGEFVARLGGIATAYWPTWERVSLHPRRL